jgi:hypothetical protein
VGIGVTSRLRGNPGVHARSPRRERVTPGFVAAVSNFLDATPQLAEDFHVDGLRRSLALAEATRTVEIHSREVEIDVGAPQSLRTT